VTRVKRTADNDPFHHPPLRPERVTLAKTRGADPRTVFSWSDGRWPIGVSGVNLVIPRWLWISLLVGPMLVFVAVSAVRWIL